MSSSSARDAVLAPSARDLGSLERYRGLIDDPRAFAEALRRPLPVTVWANEARLPAAGLEALLADGGVAFEPLAWRRGAYRLPAGCSPGNRFEYVTGLYHVQEEVSMLPVELLAPRPGERVLDLCAAPGNKTAQIALAVGADGCVVANDRNQGRMSVLRRALDRLGVSNCVTTVHDGSNYPVAAGAFDRVLVDAPCSCEGTWRKFPGLASRPRPMQPGALAGLQFALLRKAVQLTRVGGRIVYSTCTYAPEENEAVVDRVLAAFPGKLAVRPARVEGFASAPGLVAWEGRSFDPSLGGALRAYPHLNDSGGFFVAVLDKLGPVGHDAPELPPPVFEQEREPWLGGLAERYGLDLERFADQLLLRVNRRYLALAGRGIRPPRKPAPHTIGMPFLHTGMALPKPTTAGAFRLAPGATRGVVDLDREQTDAYLHRRAVELGGERSAALAGGHALVRHRGVGLGVGAHDPARGELASLFPKGWALADERSAF